MERLKGLLRQTEFHVLFFHLCLVLFGWPLVVVRDLESLQKAFYYSFLIWTAVIVVLFLVSRSVSTSDEPEQQ